MDESENVIQLPLDGYQLSRLEQGVVTTANDLAMSRCMAAAGFGQYWPFVDHRRPDPTENWRYGVWVEAQVARFGYQSLPPSTREQTLRKLNDLEFPPDVDAAYQDCIVGVRELGLAYAVPADPGASGSLAGTQDPMKSDGAVAVLEEWRTCLKRNGVTPPNEADNKWFPEGVVQAPLEQQIRVGLIDVNCKRSLKVVQRLADIEASNQVPYIEEHEAALVAQLRDAQKVLFTAREYLSKAEIEDALG